MGSKGMMWIVITIFATVFGYIGSLFGGNVIFGLWSNVFGVLGSFLGLWVWFKFLRNI